MKKEYLVTFIQIIEKEVSCVVEAKTVAEAKKKGTSGKCSHCELPGGKSINYDPYISNSKERFENIQVFDLTAAPAPTSRSRLKSKKPCSLKRGPSKNRR